MLTQHEAGIYCKGNFEMMKEKITEVIEDEKSLGQMGQNAFNYAKNNHQVDQAVQKVDQIIQSISRSKILGV